MKVQLNCNRNACREQQWDSLKPGTVYSFASKHGIIETRIVVEKIGRTSPNRKYVSYKTVIDPVDGTNIVLYKDDFNDLKELTIYPNAVLCCSPE